jgi:ABC-type transport system substrate-binding protein
MWEGENLGPWVKYDPAEAKKMLAAAGQDKMTIDALFTSLTSLRGLTYSAGTAMWEAAGLKVKIDAPTDTAVINQQKWGTNPDGTAGTFPGTFFLSDYTLGNDADIMTYTAMNSKSITNIYHINDPKIDKMTVDQRHALTKPERLQILKDLMTYDLDQVTRIWFVEPYKIGMRRPNVYNVVDSGWAWMPPAWGMVNTEVVWKGA